MSASYNRVVLVGNLTRDPEVRHTPGGTAVCDLGLAINRTFFDKQANAKKEETVFCDVTCWSRTAEVAGEYLSKGRSVLIEGRLALDEWDDKTTGKKRSKLKVVCENLTMLGSRSDSQQSAPRESSPADSFYDSSSWERCAATGGEEKPF